MVDERRVERLLRRITQDVAVLRRRADDVPVPPAGQRDRLDALKYTLVTAIEGCIGVAQHICASESWAPPATNADAFRVLAANGVLEDDFAERMARAAGLRNVLVHQYAEVDDARVVAFLDELADLNAFVTGVTSWMASSDQPDQG
ncbi:MAG: DUF86 domain-containing protein [Actinomycetota bacterium]|nr:DUF86 domain-containing protein [Actinomycetota bacterium]